MIKIHVWHHKTCILHFLYQTLWFNLPSSSSIQKYFLGHEEQQCSMQMYSSFAFLIINYYWLFSTFTYQSLYILTCFNLSYPVWNIELNKSQCKDFYWVFEEWEVGKIFELDIIFPVKKMKKRIHKQQKQITNNKFINNPVGGIKLHLNIC